VDPEGDVVIMASRVADKKETPFPPWEELSAKDKQAIAKEFKQKSITKKEYDAFRRMLGTQEEEEKEYKSLMPTPGLDAAKGGVVKSKKKKSSKSKKPNALAVTIIIPTGSTNKKASMMSGGMANKRNHMYPGGGHVTDKRKGK
jgi:hypothetical protein